MRSLNKIQSKFWLSFHPLTIYWPFKTILAPNGATQMQTYQDNGHYHNSTFYSLPVSHFVHLICTVCTTVQGSYTGDPLEGLVPLVRTETYYNKHAKSCSRLSCTQPETTRLLIFAPTMALDCQRHFQTALIHGQLLHLTIIQPRAKCTRAKQSSWASLVFLQVFFWGGGSGCCFWWFGLFLDAGTSFWHHTEVRHLTNNK